MNIDTRAEKVLSKQWRDFHWHCSTVLVADCDRYVRGVAGAPRTGEQSAGNHLTTTRV